MAAEVGAAEADPDFSDRDLDRFADSLHALWGIDARSYQGSFLRRQLRTVLRDRKLSSIDQLIAAMGDDRATLDAVQAALAVPVTEMFRDPPAFEALRRYVLPELATYPFVRVWSAGCATGEEAYSLSILLSEMGLDDRYRIYATDINRHALAQARAGVCSVGKAAVNEANYQASGGTQDFQRYFVSDGQSTLLRRQWRDSIVFATHNLTSDASFNDFQLILCRNVLIYFVRGARETAYELMLDSLSDYGYLMLGRNESPGVSVAGKKFQVACRDSRIYRRDPLG